MKRKVFFLVLVSFGAIVLSIVFYEHDDLLNVVRVVAITINCWLIKQIIKKDGSGTRNEI